MSATLIYGKSIKKKSRETKDPITLVYSLWVFGPIKLYSNNDIGLILTLTRSSYFLTSTQNHAHVQSKQNCMWSLNTRGSGKEVLFGISDTHDFDGRCALQKPSFPEPEGQ